MVVTIHNKPREDGARKSFNDANETLTQPRAHHEYDPEEEVRDGNPETPSGGVVTGLDASQRVMEVDGLIVTRIEVGGIDQQGAREHCEDEDGDGDRLRHHPRDRQPLYRALLPHLGRLSKLLSNGKTRELLSEGP